MTETAPEVQSPPTSVKELRAQFLDYIFADNEGHLCIAYANKAKSNFSQRFFEWPKARQSAANFIHEIYEDNNVWFCVNLFRTPERRKEHALPSHTAWADLDAVDPANVTPAPTCVVESSKDRYHAYWRISGDPVPIDIAEDYSRRLAYGIGADKSGWDSTQLLRVPWTKNYKYNPVEDVKLLAVVPVTYDAVEFDKLAPVLQLDEAPGAQDLPTDSELPDIEHVLYGLKMAHKIDEEFSRLYSRAPDTNADWSRLLWRLINKCLDMDMSKEEVFVIAANAACNKYKRDNRPISYLWKEVLKAAQEHGTFEILVGGKVKIDKMPNLVDFNEFEEDSFVKEYKAWANEATDAPEQYHELSCFIGLSAVMCNGLFVKVEWGEIVPNIWGLVLGESTLTRKTTAMRLAVDMLKDIDENIILATDGSAEGLLTGLSLRPSRVSLFWRDEVSGLFDAINKKDYLAGLPETLTHLYDVPKVYTRLLRKETISIQEPYFIFFGGGIRDKVYSLLSEEYIISGFLPRFLIVSGDNDLTRLRLTGPPTQVNTDRKDRIVSAMTDFKDRYNPHVTINVAGQEVDIPTRIEARLTDEAWKLHNTYEEILVKAGAESDMHELALPTFSRMSISIVKLALLIAASRRGISDSNVLEVNADDVKQAAFYIQKWGVYAIDLLVNAGRSQSERLIDRSVDFIRRKNGLTRAEFMQRLHLDARQARDLIDTMVQRGLIDVKQAGRGQRLYVL